MIKYLQEGKPITIQYANVMMSSLLVAFLKAEHSMIVIQVEMFAQHY